MFYMHDIGWGWGLVTTIGMVAVWALVIYGVVWLVRNAVGASGAPRERTEAPPYRPEPPEDILKRRLASGEITVEEYERAREALAGGPPSGEPPQRPREPAVH